MYQFNIERQRDPFQVKMEQEVLSKLKEWSIDNTPAPKKGWNRLPSDNISLTPEEAIKQLQELEKKNVI